MNTYIAKHAKFVRVSNYPVVFLLSLCALGGLAGDRAFKA